MKGGIEFGTRTGRPPMRPVAVAWACGGEPCIGDCDGAGVVE